MKTQYATDYSAELDNASNITPRTTFTSFEGKVYAGGVRNFDPIDSQIVAILPTYDASGKQLTEGKLEDDKMIRTAESLYSGDGITDTPNVSDIKSINVIQEVFSSKWRIYMLENTVRKISMPNLVGQIDYISTKLAAEAKVPELVEANVRGSAYTRVNFDLWKNVTHLVKSDKAMKQSSHPIMDIDIEQAGRSIAKLRNTQIKTVLEAADSGTGGSDWGIQTTTGQSDNDPLVDILGAVKTIRAADFDPNFIALDDQVWQEYLTNSFVKESHQRILQDPLTLAVTLPGYPNIKVVVDSAMTDTIAVVGDNREWGVLGDGPKEVAQYRNESAGFDAWIIRDWMEVKEINDAALVKLTAVTA